jgi:hypothetical protein
MVITPGFTRDFPRGWREELLNNKARRLQMTKLYCHTCSQFVSEDDAKRVKICDDQNYGHGNIQFAEWDDPQCPDCGDYLAEEYECLDCDEIAVANKANEQRCRRHLIMNLTARGMQRAEESLVKMVSGTLSIEIDDILQGEVTEAIKAYYKED